MMARIADSPLTSEDRRSGRAALKYIAAGLGAVTLLVMLALVQGSAESAMAKLVSWLPLSYSLAAGMVASVNPCGFLMLPTYVSYYLGIEEQSAARVGLATRLWRAFQLGTVGTLGFILVFGLAGVLVSLGGRWLNRLFPYVGPLIGLCMIALGVWLLGAHRSLGIAMATRLTITPKRNLRNVLLFGMVYALASLGCTLPVFLVVVGSALTAQSPWLAMSQFVGFAFGMGLVLIAVTLGAALFKDVVARRLRGSARYVHYISALFLVFAGAYLVYYWLVVASPY